MITRSLTLKSKTKEEAINAVAVAQKKVKDTLLLIKNEVGTEEAKIILNRIMDTARQQTKIR